LTAPELALFLAAVSLPITVCNTIPAAVRSLLEQICVTERRPLMIDLLLFAWFFVFLSAVGGVLLALVCLVDWISNSAKKHVKEKDNA